MKNHWTSVWSLSLCIWLIANFSVAAQNTGNYELVTELKIGKRFQMYSNTLGEVRHFGVFLPESYPHSPQAYPVVYVLDGDAYYLTVNSAIRALAGQGAMPEAIMVAISNPEREVDMTPDYINIPGVDRPAAGDFLAFLTQELIPVLDKNYRTLPLRLLVGHSHGGLFSLYALTESPEVFRWILSIDPPMHLNDHILEKRVNDFARENRHHRGRLATIWSRYGWDEKRWQQLNEYANGLNVMSLELRNEPHSAMYYLAVYKGFKKLFGDYRYVHDSIITLEELDRRYSTMTAEYGYEVRVPRQAIQNGALEHLVAGDPLNARLFVERLLQKYATTTIMQDDALVWLERLEADPPAESRTAYLSKPDATPVQILDFQGNWTDGDKFELEIQVDGENIKGFWKQIMPNGTVLSSELEKYILKKDGALEVSYSNRMMPLSALNIVRLLPPAHGRLQAETRVLAYWPRMQSRMHIEQLTLYKIKQQEN